MHAAHHEPERAADDGQLRKSDSGAGAGSELSGTVPEQSSAGQRSDHVGTRQQYQDAVFVHDGFVGAARAWATGSRCKWRTSEDLRTDCWRKRIWRCRSIHMTRPREWITSRRRRRWRSCIEAGVTTNTFNPNMVSAGGAEVLVGHHAEAGAGRFVCDRRKQPVRKLRVRVD